MYAALLDVPRVALAVPGVSDVEPAGDDRYRGTLTIRVGPMRFAFRGEVAIVAREPDRAATLRAEAQDRGVGGSVRAAIAMALEDVADGTELRIASDVQVLGRIGELGQPIMKRKADELLGYFVANLERELRT